MSEKYEIVAVDTHSEHDCGFTVKFEKTRNVMLEGYPFDENVAIYAVEDAYNWYPTLEQITELEEGQRVGYVYVDENGEYVKSEFEPETV
jgi:hypothetical protein